jgi:hypothetical protein
MQVYDLLFLNFIQVSQTLHNGVLHEDKYLFLFGYTKACPYLSAA